MGTWVNCPSKVMDTACNGRGWYYGDARGETKITCHICAGSGQVPCPLCGGNGRRYQN